MGKSYSQPFCEVPQTQESSPYGRFMEEKTQPNNSLIRFRIPEF